MSDSAALLAMLRHGDSAFPGGAASFSWGLETLVREGYVRGADDLEAMIADQLGLRWATSDRSALEAAWDAGDDLDGIARIDRILESRALARELREGSRRAGGALLTVHVRLGTAPAAAYRARLAPDTALRHLAAMQGMLWRACGIGRTEAALMSAHTVALSATGAAIRLGIVGHIDAQRIVGRAAAAIAELLRMPAPPVEAIHAFVPLIEIAAMRHETGEARLFSN